MDQQCTQSSRSEGDVRTVKIRWQAVLYPLEGGGGGLHSHFRHPPLPCTRRHLLLIGTETPCRPTKEGGAGDILEFKGGASGGNVGLGLGQSLILRRLSGGGVGMESSQGM